MDYPNNLNRANSNLIHRHCTCPYHHAMINTNNNINDIAQYPSDQMAHTPFFTQQIPPIDNINNNAFQQQSIAHQISPNTNYLNDPFQTVNNGSGSRSPTASNISNTYSSLSTISSDNASSDHYYPVDYTNNVYNDHPTDFVGTEPYYDTMPPVNNMYPYHAQRNGQQQQMNHQRYPSYPNHMQMQQDMLPTEIESQTLPPYPYIIPTSNQHPFMEDTKLFAMKPIPRRGTPTTAQLGGYQCTVCGKKFKHKCNLKIHGVIHTPSALSCSFCGKKFARISNLNEHIKIHTNFRPFRCQFCDKTFRQKQTLIDHIRTHTGERPFKCDFCTKAFKVKHNLKSHRRLHTGERPFICPLCPKKFASKSSLNGHIRRKHCEYWNNRQRK